jgi:hypothetical protein
MKDSKKKSEHTQEKKGTSKPEEEDLKSLQQEEISGSPDEKDHSLEYSDTDEDEDEGVGDGNVGRSISEI